MLSECMYFLAIRLILPDMSLLLLGISAFVD